MVEAGINFVRMGEFAWCVFEPSPGQYEFDWLDRVVDQMGANGIETIICTPTACPPAWLVEKHPEVLYVDNRGVTRPFGGRRSYCYNNPIYRDYSQRIAAEIGAHYGKHPHVYAFQIDNEFAQEGTGRCHCQVCQIEFQNWLEEKYTTIDELNKRMGTIFWGQTYTNFGQINLPVNTIEVNATQSIRAHHENPSLRLDFERFCSDSTIVYQDIQGDAIKEHTDKIVTTNATGLATNSIDYYQAFSKLDKYAFDYYPSLRHKEVSSFPYAHGRGICDDSFWLLEFVSGGGHRLGGSGRLQQYPNALTQAAIHAFAAGADLVAHFQFRTFPFGAEQLNYAIVDADGIPRRQFEEVQKAARDLEILKTMLADSTIENEVAICFDYDVHWALKIKPFSKDFDYLKFSSEIYHQLLDLGVGVDVVSYQHDLEKYKVVILPTPALMSEEHKVRVKQYVQNGGILLSTFLAGVKDRDNIGSNQTLPCGLTDLFGVEVYEVEPVVVDTVAKISLDTGKESIVGNNRFWTEELRSSGADFIGVYADSFRSGSGVISRNQFGAGQAYYLGTGLELDLLAELLRIIISEGDVTTLPFEICDGVEVIVRRYQERNVYCLFNFQQHEINITLDQAYRDLIRDTNIDGTVKVDAKDYLFIMD